MPTTSFETEQKKERQQKQHHDHTFPLFPPEPKTWARVSSTQGPGAVLSACTRASQFLSVGEPEGTRTKNAKWYRAGSSSSQSWVSIKMGTSKYPSLRNTWQLSFWGWQKAQGSTPKISFLQGPNIRPRLQCQEKKGPMGQQSRFHPLALLFLLSWGGSCAKSTLILRTKDPFLVHKNKRFEILNFITYTIITILCQTTIHSCPEATRLPKALNCGTEDHVPPSPQSLSITVTVC